MKKILLLLAVCLCLISLASAEDVVIQSLGNVQQNSCVTLKQSCGNCTFVNVTSVEYKINSTQLLGEVVMTKIKTEYNYSFCGTASLGHYIVNGKGDPDGILTSFGYDFWVTGNGEAVAGDGLKIFIFSLFIIVTVGLLYSFIIQLAKIATMSMTIYDIIMSWSFLLLMIIVYYLSNSYLTASYVLSLTSMFITISIWSNGVLPLISFIVTFFYKITQKKKPLTIEEIRGRSPFYG